MPSWRVIESQDDDLLTHLCKLRGFDSQRLVPDFTADLHDPWLLPDMELACELIDGANQRGERAVIFGDYDADGTPAAALLSLAFGRIGLVNEVLLPSRGEGYGLRPRIIEQIASQAQLLVTVDNGITAVEEIALARKLGLKVIVLDHHLPPPVLPRAHALVDPFLADSRYPFKYLCGCALAYKLVEALAKSNPSLDESYRKWLLDLVAISTVGDMMPLVGENRALVHYGLRVLGRNRRPGLRALMAMANLEPEQIVARDLGFIIAPRLNASGRLTDNRPALDLLLADNADSANAAAKVIETANTERQRQVESALNEALAGLPSPEELTDKIILRLGNWLPGIVGLVAGRLAGRYGRPAIVGSLADGQIRASARSIKAYPLVEALQAHSNLLSHFGGHAQAAGLSLSEDNWPKLVDGLRYHAGQKLTDEDLIVKPIAEAVIDPRDLTTELAHSLEALAPFGEKNPRPAFVLQQAEILDSKTMGSAGQYRKYRLNVAGVELDGVAFSPKTDWPTESGPVDLLGDLSLNTWRGRTTLQFKIADLTKQADLEIVAKNEIKDRFHL